MADNKGNKVPLDATLRLKVLGGASLSYLLPTQELTQVLGPGKPLALLVYLAHLPDRTATRDHVLDLLWSNQAPSMAKPALRQAIWYIRQRIGSSGIESGDGMIRLAIPLESDADLFESAVDDGQLERAVGLYSGPFLPELAIPGGAEFEHWTNAERARLESMFLRTSEVVIRSWMSQGQYQKAEKLARTIRDMNRVRQAWWRLLLEVLTSSGDAVRATVAADELERTLLAEGLKTDRATNDAIRLARQMPTTVAEQSSGRAMVAELVGREREFATIVGAWDEAKAGSGRHLTMTGGAGYGKTRLLTDVHMRLHASGEQVVRLRANVGERQIEFALASNLAAGLSQLPGAKGIPPACAATLVALNPSLSSVYDVPVKAAKEADVLRMRTIALCELLAAVAHEYPIAVLIDDLHWIDAASRNVLGGIAGCLEDNPALMVTASRPAARGGLQDSAQEEITLQPLTLDHVSALVSSIGTLPDAEWVGPAMHALRDENGGSPLLVLESLQLAIDRGSLTCRDGAWSCKDCEALVAEFKQGGALRNRVAKLERSESWTLLILAVAGMPVSIGQLAQMTGRSEQSLFPVVMALEQRGFVARVENELEPAHDEIGALAVELAAADAAPAARGAVGRVLAEEAADNDHLLLRAGQLLASATDRGRLNEVFRKRLWLARSRGDMRPSRDLAREMLGASYSVEASKALFGSLPLYFRLGLTSTRRITAAVSFAFLLCLAGGAVALWPDPPPPDAILVAYDLTRGSDGKPLGAGIRRDSWRSATPVEMAPWDEAPRIDSVHGVPIRSPDGTRWAFSRLRSDSGEIDIYVVDNNGEELRLTHTPNDDEPFDWSPDGKRLVFASSRWHEEEIYEAATIDVETGEVVRLTYSAHSESQMRWSPDGARIGYLRSMLGDETTELCWTTPHADPPDCVEGVRNILAWYDTDDLLVVADSSGVSRLGQFNLSRGDFHTLYLSDRSERLTASRDGQWIAALRRDSVSGGRFWRTFPVDAPSMGRQVALQTDRGDDFHLVVSQTRSLNAHIENLQIERPSTNLAVGIPFLMHAAGFDPNGRRVPLPQLTWSGNRPAVATVDANGAIRPRGVGEITVLVTAGGWRSDSLTLSVEQHESASVMLENWADDWTTRWDPYGMPDPEIALGPDAISGFWNNGDRSFQSGTYSLQEWPADRGVGVEAVVSTVVTIPYQQTFTLALAGWIDTVRVAAWDHREGRLPGRSGSARPHQCLVTYPDRNSVLEGEIRLQPGTEMAAVNAGFPVHTGQWHRLRLQVFPDGTCGLAINGRAIVRSTNRIPLDGEYRVWSEGKSIGSKMLLGPLEVWTGVKTDVDWAVLDWPN